jgi:hypothetical protein
MYSPVPCAGGITHVTHHVVARHRIEVEVWPPRVELAFRDEKWINPIDAQCRFEATVYNSRQGATWSVSNLSGGPGAGSIDQQGLYRAPIKGGIPSGYTDIVVATATEDPLRKAFAWVTVLGEGPEPLPAPIIEIWPKRAHLYYQTGDHNTYVDASNKRQLFSATLAHTSATNLDWLVNGVVQTSGPEPTFLYVAPNNGATQMVTVRARIAGQPGVFDDAKVIQLNYLWPGLQ